MDDPKRDLLRLMSKLRGSLDPDVVRRLDLAKEGKVPYDRKAAHEAVRRFLEERPDGARLLAERLKGRLPPGS